MARSAFSLPLAAVALSGVALVVLSGCTASAPVAEPSSTPTAPFAWQQIALQEQADEFWDRVQREFPDATRPDAEFIEWSTRADSGGMDLLIDCINESPQSPAEENAVAGYVCRVQYPEKLAIPTEDTDPQP